MAGVACQCFGPKKERMKRWRVRQRNQSRSAFNGYMPRYSESSDVICLDCPGAWRTKARYVDDLPDVRPSETYGRRAR